MPDDPNSKGLPLLVEEIQNFEEIAASLVPSPGDIPQLEGLDIYGLSKPLHSLVGGDHIIYIDFNRRFDLDARIRQAEAIGRVDLVHELRQNRRRAGILVADVAGHRITDALVAAMLHQAFLLGVLYELELYGQITTKIFENIKKRFYRSSTLNKYVTMIYGEISDQGKFRFISAAHPPPVVYSGEFERIVKLDSDRTVSSTPIGMFTTSDDVDDHDGAPPPRLADRHTVNEIVLLGTGDILLLYTDGLSEHDKGRFFPGRLEQLLGEARTRSAKEICEHIWKGVLEATPPEDDISFVVVKKL